MFNLFKSKNQPVGERHIIKIKKMHCPSCAINIDGALEDLDGVHTASTNYAKGETQINFDPQKITLQVIETTIKNLGYET